MVQDNDGVTINQSRLGNYIRLRAQLKPTEKAEKTEGTIIPRGTFVPFFQAEPLCLPTIGLGLQLF